MPSSTFTVQRDCRRVEAAIQTTFKGMPPTPEYTKLLCISLFNRHRGLPAIHSDCCRPVLINLVVPLCIPYFIAEPHCHNLTPIPKTLPVTFDNTTWSAYFATHLEIFGQLLAALVARVHGNEICHIALEPDQLAVAWEHELFCTNSFRVRNGQHLQLMEEEVNMSWMDGFSRELSFFDEMVLPWKREDTGANRPYTTNLVYLQHHRSTRHGYGYMTQPYARNNVGDHREYCLLKLEGGVSFFCQGYVSR